MNYIFVTKNTDYTSKLIWQLQDLEDVKIVYTDESMPTITPNDKIYIPSDTVYPLVRSCFDESRKKIVDNFRNKYEFRKTISALFPRVVFNKIELADLKNFIPVGHEKYIVKPLTGFMGAGARIIDSNSNLQEVSDEISAELAKYSKLYPNIFSSEVIIESYIEGADEYAVDMYYDKNGKPVIINIYCHPEAARKEYLQMLYYTSGDIFKKFYDQFIDFFGGLNKTINAQSFPIHAEFKLNDKGEMIPIEFNSCRFGGMGLADLTNYAFGFNPIKAFFDDYAPDWKKIWLSRDDEYFCWVLGYNAADIDVKNRAPNHEKFKTSFPASSKLLGYENLDHLKSPGFALAYLSTKNKDDLERLLKIEFNDFF